jgi:hypothetical protein
MSGRWTVRRTFVAVVVAVAVAATLPLGGAAQSGQTGAAYRLPPLTHQGVAAPLAGASRSTPVVLGGRTAQGLPIVIQTSASGKKVVSALTVLDLRSGDTTMLLPDAFENLTVKNGRFSMRWGPEPLTGMPAGGTGELSGTIAGRLSRDRSKASGTWTYHAVLKNAAGTVTAVWDCGSMKWSVRQ